MTNVWNGTVPDEAFWNLEEGDERFINTTEHNKALHDALLINADTVDGLHAVSFALADGTRLRAPRSNTAPAAPGLGQLWIDTNTTPGTLKNWNGTSWEILTAGGSGGGGGVTDHGDLTGRNDDDHLLYALADGTRLVIRRASTPPLSPGVGTPWTDTNFSPARLKSWTGSVWETIGSVSSGGGGGGSAEATRYRTFSKLER